MDAVSSEDERKEYITDMHGEHRVWLYVIRTYAARPKKWAESLRMPAYS